MKVVKIRGLVAASSNSLDSGTKLLKLRRPSGSGRTGDRGVDLGGPSVYQGGQSIKLSTKAAVCKRVSLLIGEAKHVDWGGRPLQIPLGAGPGFWPIFLPNLGCATGME